MKNKYKVDEENDEEVVAVEGIQAPEPYKKKYSFDDGQCIKSSKTVAHKPVFHRYLVVIGIISFFFLLGIYASVAMRESVKFKYYSFALWCCVGCYVLLLIDYYGHFEKFKYFLENGFNGRLPYILLTADLIISFITFISLQLSDSSEDVEFVQAAWVDYAEYFCAFVIGFMTVAVCIAYWDYLSFRCSQSPWVLSFFYLTIIGYVVVWCARYVHPPVKREDSLKTLNWSWHMHHPENKILECMTRIIFLCCVFFVIMGTVLLALFTDITNTISVLGIVPIIVIFSIFGLTLMITPLAPGSVVDICGGYVMVNLFMIENDWSFGGAWLLAFIIMVVLHFIGSCLQWFIGRMDCAQGWMNQTFPPMMLAASESTLQEAGCVKVGIVGQVFMDTANGMNQGRMNMKFCTQFWSEWSSLPNAVSLVTLGACLSTPGKVQLVYIVGMVAGILQVVLASVGAKELASSLSTLVYITSFEKWTMVQYMARKGYFATVEGWKNDVWEMGSAGGLYDEISKGNMAKTSEQSKTLSLAQENALLLKYQRVMQQYRDRHFATFDEERLNRLVAGGLLHYDETKVVVEDAGTWDDASWDNWKGYLQCLMFVIMYISYGVAYMYTAVEMQQAVSEGFAVFNDNPMAIYGFVALTTNVVVAIIYWHATFYGGIVDLMNLFVAVGSCKCLEGEAADVETEFLTIEWLSASEEQAKELDISYGSE